MANATVVNISISTATEFMDFFYGTIQNYTNYNVTIENDIDFIDYGVITKQSELSTGTTQSNVIIDLQGHTIMNIYPIFIAYIYNQTYCLNVRNGYITNVLINTGAAIKSDRIGYFQSPTFRDILSSSNDKSGSYNSIYGVVFENVGFSLLGCNFMDTSKYASSVLIALQQSTNFEPVFLFKQCSFYIKAYHAEPMINNALFMNCSIHYEVYYKKIDFNQPGSNYQRNNVYCFCTFDGYVKKDEGYVDVPNVKTVLGYMYNSYYNVETDIEKPLYIACNEEKYNGSYYQNLLADSYGADISEYVFDTTTVYNRDKYLPEIVEGKNCTPILGATGLSESEMHNTDVLLTVGLLAVQEDA